MSWNELCFGLADYGFDSTRVAFFSSNALNQFSSVYCFFSVLRVRAYFLSPDFSSLSISSAVTALLDPYYPLSSSSREVSDLADYECSLCVADDPCESSCILLWATLPNSDVSNSTFISLFIFCILSSKFSPSFPFENFGTLALLPEILRAIELIFASSFVNYFIISWLFCLCALRWESVIIKVDLRASCLGSTFGLSGVRFSVDDSHEFFFQPDDWVSCSGFTLIDEWLEYLCTFGNSCLYEISAI